MTVCPIAIAVGCKRCPAFAICPLKSVLGDQAKSEADKGIDKPKRSSPTGRGGARKR